MFSNQMITECRNDGYKNTTYSNKFIPECESCTAEKRNIISLNGHRYKMIEMCNHIGCLNLINKCNIHDKKMNEHSFSFSNYVPTGFNLGN